MSLKNKVEISANLRQLDWITDDNGEIIVNHILKLENINEDFMKLKNKINLQLNLSVPHVNKSEHDHYSKYYTDKTKNMIEEIHKREIEMFGYFGVDGWI